MKNSTLTYICIVFLYSFFLSLPINAKTIASCGSSDGYAAYLRNGNLGSQGDFSKDGFSNSKIILEAEGDKVDIVFYNGSTPYRASNDGFVSLINHNKTNNTWMVLAVTNNYIDTYLFYLDNSGRGEVVWTNSGSGGTPKAVLMRARCR